MLVSERGNRLDDMGEVSIRGKWVDLMPRLIQFEAIRHKSFLFDDLEWTISFIVEFL